MGEWNCPFISLKQRICVPNIKQDIMHWHVTFNFLLCIRFVLSVWTLLWALDAAITVRQLLTSLKINGMRASHKQFTHDYTFLSLGICAYLCSRVILYMFQYFFMQNNNFIYFMLYIHRNKSIHVIKKKEK